MWLIVGLGNPGSRYDETPHNFGFEIVRTLADRHRLRWSSSRQARAEVAKGEIAGEEVALMMPTTFMNLSGEAVSPFARYYKVPSQKILVVSDEVQLPWGRLRMRTSGSHGGHNGLRNIILHLGTNEFPRLRVGCEPVNWRGDLAAFVLAKLKGEALGLAQHMVEISTDAAEDVIKRGVQKSQATFNGYDALKEEK